MIFDNFYLNLFNLISFIICKTAYKTILPTIIMIVDCENFLVFKKETIKLGKFRML